MKLKLTKIVEILVKLKDDTFYFKNYAPEIIESYTDETAIAFYDWCEENKGWIDRYSTREKLVVFKLQTIGEDLPDNRCKCIKYINSEKWYSNGCKIHPEEK